MHQSFIKLICLLLSMWRGMAMHLMAQACRSEDSLWESVLFLHHVGPKHQRQVSDLGTAPLAVESSQQSQPLSVQWHIPDAVGHVLVRQREAGGRITVLSITLDLRLPYKWKNAILFTH